MTDLENKKQQAAQWFKQIRDDICSMLEGVEDSLTTGEHAGLPAGRFERTPWDRDSAEATPNHSGSILQGGGEISLMRGRVFEKFGVNISTVHGTFAPEFRDKIPGAVESEGAFWASGISLVGHPRSPLVPAVHMNTRMIVTSQCWFGGGADLTPVFPVEQDTADFHAAFKDCSDKHNPAYYPEFKDWCDRYFFLPHRNEARGVGGIFYDYLQNDWDADFAYTQDVGRTFRDIYQDIATRHVNKSWSEEQREAQLIKRGRYVEYNLLYDRGTQFGLKTGGNTEAILMSLPPIVKWP